MQINQRGGFGRREAPFGKVKAQKIEREIEYVAARWTSGRGWKDYAFYAVLGIGIFSAIVRTAVRKSPTVAAG